MGGNVPIFFNVLPYSLILILLNRDSENEEANYLNEDANSLNEDVNYLNEDVATFNFDDDDYEYYTYNDIGKTESFY